MMKQYSNMLCIIGQAAAATAAAAAAAAGTGTFPDLFVKRLCQD